MKPKVKAQFANTPATMSRGTPREGQETGSLGAFNEVSRNKPSSIHSVTAVCGEWERIPVKLDSGAVDTVMPPSVGTNFKLTQTELSKTGPGFNAANGSHIEHYGQRKIRGMSDEYRSMTMTAQVADVRNTLMSVYQILLAGHSVHFERGNCYIKNQRTGNRNPIVEKQGSFEIGLWVPKSKNRVEQVLETRVPKIGQNPF